MKKDGVVGVSAIIVSLFFLYQTTLVRIPENLAEPGPRIVPYISLVLIIICGIGMVMESFKSNNEKKFLTKEGWKKLGYIYGVLFAYAVGLTYFGFLLTTPFIAFIVIKMLSGDNKISFFKKLLVSVFLTIGFYVIFTSGFGVMLPQGML